MKPDADAILRSLEIVAERCEDLVPPVYGRFYARFPEARKMFGRDENNFHQGQMFNGMLLAIIEHAEGRCPMGSIRAWVADHNALGVGREMFPVMFSAVFEAIKAAMGDAWNDEFEGAWHRQIGGLAAQFETVFDGGGR